MHFHGGFPFDFLPNGALYFMIREIGPPRHTEEETGSHHEKGDERRKPRNGLFEASKFGVSYPLEFS